MTSQNSHEPYVRVFQSYDQSEFDLVKGFLEARGIPFITTGDAAAEFGMKLPNRMPTLDEPAGSQLFVPPKFAKQARTALAQTERRSRNHRPSESPFRREVARFEGQAAWLLVIGVLLAILWNAFQMLRR